MTYPKRVPGTDGVHRTDILITARQMAAIDALCTARARGWRRPSRSAVIRELLDRALGFESSPSPEAA